jgi:hypothetical protein
MAGKQEVNYKSNETLYFNRRKKAVTWREIEFSGENLNAVCGMP